jgi:hypothetical protein
VLPLCINSAFFANDREINWNSNQTYRFSDPQGGKAAHIKNHMNKYLNSENDIENPEQMKAAIKSFEGIPGVKVTVCGVKGMAGEWDGVSLSHQQHRVLQRVHDGVDGIQ